MLVQQCIPFLLQSWRSSASFPLLQVTQRDPAAHSPSTASHKPIPLLGFPLPQKLMFFGSHLSSSLVCAGYCLSVGYAMAYWPSVTISAKVQVVWGAEYTYECVSSHSTSESCANSQIQLVWNSVFCSLVTPQRNAHRWVPKHMQWAIDCIFSSGSW